MLFLQCFCLSLKFYQNKLPKTLNTASEVKTVRTQSQKTPQPKTSLRDPDGQSRACRQETSTFLISSAKHRAIYTPRRSSVSPRPALHTDCTAQALECGSPEVCARPKGHPFQKAGLREPTPGKAVRHSASLLSWASDFMGRLALLGKLASLRMKSKPEGVVLLAPITGSLDRQEVLDVHSWNGTKRRRLGIHSKCYRSSKRMGSLAAHKAKAGPHRQLPAPIISCPGTYAALHMIHSPAPLVVAIVILHGVRVSSQEGVLDLGKTRRNVVLVHCGLDGLGFVPTSTQK